MLIIVKQTGHCVQSRWMLFQEASRPSLVGSLCCLCRTNNRRLESFPPPSAPTAPATSFQKVLKAKSCPEWLTYVHPCLLNYFPSALLLEEKSLLLKWFTQKENTIVFLSHSCLPDFAPCKFPPQAHLTQLCHCWKWLSPFHTHVGFSVQPSSPSSLK